MCLVVKYMKFITACKIKKEEGEERGAKKQVSKVAQKDSYEEKKVIDEIDRFKNRKRVGNTAQGFR